MSISQIFSALFPLFHPGWCNHQFFPGLLQLPPVLLFQIPVSHGLQNDLSKMHTCLRYSGDSPLPPVIPVSQHNPQRHIYLCSIICDITIHVTEQTELLSSSLASTTLLFPLNGNVSLHICPANSSFKKDILQKAIRCLFSAPY